MINERVELRESIIVGECDSKGWRCKYGGNADSFYEGAIFASCVHLRLYLMIELQFSYRV